MFNVIIATHGHLATGFLEILQSFFGKTQQVTAIELGNQGIEQFSTQVDKTVASIGKQPTIVLCDIAGGTPYNEFAKRSILWQEEFYLFGGVSLPILVETLNLRMQHETLKKVTEKIQRLSSLTKFELKNIKGAEDE